ncbi:MAG: hypothetical protein ABI618_06775 [Nitrospirota bacterium]
MSYARVGPKNFSARQSHLFGVLALVVGNGLGELGYLPLAERALAFTPMAWSSMTAIGVKSAPSSRN